MPLHPVSLRFILILSSPVVSSFGIFILKFCIALGYGLDDRGSGVRFSVDMFRAATHRYALCISVPAKYRLHLTSGQLLSIHML